MYILYAFLNLTTADLLSQLAAYTSHSVTLVFHSNWLTLISRWDFISSFPLVLDT